MFSLTIPWFSVKSLTFPWQLSIPDISRISRQVITLDFRKFDFTIFGCECLKFYIRTYSVQQQGSYLGREASLVWWITTTVWNISVRNRPQPNQTPTGRSNVPAGETDASSRATTGGTSASASPTSPAPAASTSPNPTTSQPDVIVVRLSRV